MFWPSNALALLASLSACNTVPCSTSPPAIDVPAAFDPARRRAEAQVRSHMPGGDRAQAKADAAQAAEIGQFGLIALGNYSSSPTGVTCFTPHGQAPDTLVDQRVGDVIDDKVNAIADYALTYNHALVDRPDYPDADLCRRMVAEDRPVRDAGMLVGRAARSISGAPRTLFEAARRGSGEQIRRFLRTASVNAIDGLGMTALSWAVARDNREAVDTLLSAGANPWTAGDPWQESAVFWAASLGQGDTYKRLVKLCRGPFATLPSRYLPAALSGGDESILVDMLARPHETLQTVFLPTPLPSERLLRHILRDDPSLASPLLLKATERNARADLVRLALRNGADPNTKGREGGYETVLALASRGFEPASAEIVDLLLRAGADPNFPSHRTRPLWEAFGTLTLGLRNEATETRARAIFTRLVAGGARLDLPDDQGRPPIWFILFPMRYAHRELDASFVTPALLELLVRHGLNVNAEWNGERVLPLVETQAGHRSELALTLRRLGAHG